MSLDKNVIEDQNVLEITYRWYEPYHISGCIFFTVWSVLSMILFHEELVRLVSGGLTVAKSVAAMTLFGSLWVIPTYWMLLLTVNRTVIQLTRQEMRVRHGPFPSLAKNERFPTSDLRSIWLENADAEEGEGATDIIAVLRTGEERKVIKNVKNTEDSEMIRDRINAWLKRASNSSRCSQKPIPPSKPMVNDAT
ncbi:hypothetical protein [Desulfococcus sp.]|uniref:hypothetical protein n=1 Tax=Desulfococcus sp. TaxID=2025834 RepID=UPI003593CCAC